MNAGIEGQGARQSRIQRLFTLSPVRIVVILLCFMWSIPSLGLLVSSFRTPEEINTSGWWTSFGLYRDNPAYVSLKERVERSQTFAERTQGQLEDAQAAFEAGVSDEAMAEAVDEAKTELLSAVEDAQAELADAQAAMDAGEEGAEDRVAAAQASLDDAEAALAAGVDEAAIRADLEAELADAVTAAQDRANTGQEMLAEDMAALENSDEPKRFYFGSAGWRKQWTLENYRKVINANGMGNAFWNSLLVTIPSVVIPITIAAFAAYAFAWLEFPGKDLFFAAVIITMGVPLHLALIPILRMYIKVDLGGTYLGVWLAHTGFGLPLAIYLIYGYMITIPRDVMESAQIDGASSFTAFTRLIMPLSVPVIASFAIFQFLWVWNDLLVALVFLGAQADNAVLTTQLTRLVGSKGQDWELLTAGAFITTMVPLMVFFSLQRYFVRGMMAGSVKG